MRPELLLHPNVPKPLHGMSPRELKGSEWWDKTRKEVYAKAGYRCQCCDVRKEDALFHKWLEAHETYEYDYKNGIAIVKEIVALCHACHSYIHSGLLQVKRDKGEISYSKWQQIMLHGDNILYNAKLKPSPYVGEVAEWGKWKIVIDGEVFPTKWKSFEHWRMAYNR